MRVCYVLTGGSLRGIVAQTAALEVLEACGLEFQDVCGVVGTSAGSLSGSFYASGMEPSEMAKTFGSMTKADYIDPSWFKIIGSILLMGRGMTGIFEGKRLLSWLKKNLPVVNIENTPIPLAINVTNISKEKPEILTSGPIAESVRASTAIPFIFKPQRIGNSYYVDGGAVNNIPIDEAVRLHPEADAFIVITTIGVRETEDPEDHSWLNKPFAPLYILGRALHAISRELYKDNLNAAGKKVAILTVDPGPIDLQEVEKFGEAYRKGLRDALKKVPGILAEIGYKQ